MLAIYARTSRYIDGYSVATIEQQINAGIEFAKKHKLEYQIFSDEGISGYHISEDENNPYSNRPKFLELMQLVEKGKIDKIWVWENSRLSRNTYASSYIYHKLDTVNKQRIKSNKEPIELWIQETKYNLNNPTDAFMKTLMDAFAEYERNLIISRTTRGLYNSINTGKRSFSHFYGYTKTVRNKAGNYEYVVNEEEMNIVRNAYSLFLSGKSLREISISLMKVSANEILKVSTKLGRILKHKEYTGYSLTTDGLAIEKKFDNGEIPTLNELHNSKYWVESKVYTERIISIDEWIKIREQLQIYKNIRKEYTTNYSVDTALATGLITCSCCNQKYFIYNQKTEKGNRIAYYKHSSLFNNSLCNQRPKTIKKEKIDYILGFFYFYYTLLFDDSNKRKQSTKEFYSNQKTELEKQISELENKLKNYDKVIEKIEEAIIQDPDNYLAHSKRLDSFTALSENDSKKLIELQSQFLQIKDQYNSSAAKKEFSKIFEDWISFFLDNSIQSNRAKLQEIIKSMKLESNNLIIETENLIFNFKVETRQDKKGKEIPYEHLPISDILDNENEFYSKFSSIWNRFQNNDLDYMNKETQIYLKEIFNWKVFKVEEGTKPVISFDETTPLTEKEKRILESKRKYNQKVH